MIYKVLILSLSISLVLPKNVLANSYPFKVNVSNYQRMTNFVDIDRPKLKEYGEGDSKKRELPPLVLTLPEKNKNIKHYFLTGANTIRCRFSYDTNFYNSKGLDFSTNNDCYLAAAPEFIEASSVLNKRATESGYYEDIAEYTCIEPNQLNQDWRRNYYGIYNVHFIDNKILFLSHTENANYKCKIDPQFPNSYSESCKEKKYQSTLTDLTVDECSNTCFSGEGACYKAGFEMVTMAYMNYPPINKNTGTADEGWTNQNLFDLNELGPVVWPALGFSDNLDVYDNDTRKKEFAGAVRHPTSIIKDGYFYLFYIDTSVPSVNQTQQGYTGWKCLKLARAKLNNGLPGPFYNYYNGSFSEPSLPSGLNKWNMSEYKNTYGPKSSCIVGRGDWDGTNNRIVDLFSVAKIKNTPYYIAVEESTKLTNNKSQWQLSLLLSKDLINWSNRTILLTANNWADAYLNYPMIFDKENTTNHEIDIDKFYIFGSTGWSSSESANDGYYLGALEVSLDLSADINKDNLINKEDIKKLIQNKISNQSSNTNTYKYNYEELVDLINLVSLLN